jgi:hypothetical protein
VARSIESDVDNLMRLISVANILPKGLYVENAVKVGFSAGCFEPCSSCCGLYGGCHGLHVENAVKGGQYGCPRFCCARQSAMA